MATNFPTTLDTLSNPTATDKMNVVNHADQHANANDAIEALEAKVGVDGSAVTTSHDYKLSQVTGSNKAFQNRVSATDKLLGRSTAGAGEVEEITCTAAGRALLDDTDAAAQRTTLGLGTAATAASGDFAAASHTHTVSQITDAGALASLNTVANAQVTAAAGIVESKLSLDYGTSGLNTRIATLEDADIWNPRSRLIRSMVYRTGPTAVDCGEVGSSGGTGSVTAATTSTSQPFGANFACGSTSGNAFGWASGAHHITGVDGDFEWLILPVDSANVRYHIGLASQQFSNFGNADTPGSATYHTALISFRSSLDTNWQLITGSSSAASTTDTGIAFSAGTLIRVGLRIRNSGTDISAVINGTVVATYSGANKPNTTTALLMTGGVNTTASAAKNVRLFRQLSAVDYW